MNVSIPCDVGTTVYVLMGDRYRTDGKGKPRVTHWKVEPQTVTEISRKMGKNGKIGDWGIITAGIRRSFNTIGHTVFLEPKEAEKMAELLNFEIPEM